jgi:hypothetical protein
LALFVMRVCVSPPCYKIVREIISKTHWMTIEKDPSKVLMEIVRFVEHPRTIINTLRKFPA